jgi:hypothetical protein
MRQDGEEITFGQAWAEAIEESVDRLEAVAFDVAENGFPEVVVHQGEVSVQRDADGEPLLDQTGRPLPLVVRKWDRVVNLALLKAHRPGKYRESMQIDHTVKGGVLAIPLADGEEWEDTAKEQQKRHRESVEKEG